MGENNEQSEGVTWDSFGTSLKKGAGYAGDIISDGYGAVKKAIYDHGEIKWQNIAVGCLSLVGLGSIQGGLDFSSFGGMLKAIVVLAGGIFLTDKITDSKSNTKLAQNDTGNQPVVAKGKVREQETQLSLNEPQIEVPKTPIGKGANNAQNLFG